MKGVQASLPFFQAPQGPREFHDAFRPGLPPPPPGILLSCSAPGPGFEPQYRLVSIGAALSIESVDRSLVVSASCSGVSLWPESRSIVDEGAFDSIALRRPSGLDWTIFFPLDALPSLRSFLARSLVEDAGLEEAHAQALARRALEAVLMESTP